MFILNKEMDNYMKLLYGTTNPGKLIGMRRIAEQLDIEVIGLNELDGELPYIPEDGNDPIDNARQKAMTYYKTYGIPVFSFDSGLYFIEEPNLKQPGTYVRRYTGIDMNDNQLLEHYMTLAEKNGGTIKAQYINAISMVINEDTIYEYQGDAISYEPFLLTSKPHKKFDPGLPLNTISVEIKSGKYFYDIEGPTDDSIKRVEGIKSFFKSSLNL